MRPRRLLLCLALCLSLPSHAESNISEGQCTLSEHIWYLDVQNNIHLAQDPIDALKSGITLYFNYEINIKDGNWWQQDHKTINHELRLRYNHLTYSYQIENPITSYEQSYPTIEAALEALGTLKSLPLINDKHLDSQQRYTIRVRFRLETDKLPFSLRLTALLSNAWKLNSDWWICPQKRATD